MIKSIFRRLLTPVRLPDPAPEQPLTIIGDVHGRADLLDQALAAASGSQTILVGDYIDRGEKSAQVLRQLTENPNLVCLMGNHEDMLLQFLDDPNRHGQRWLRFGGLQTLASFGIAGAIQTSNSKQLEVACDRLKAAMGSDLIGWIRALPSIWQSGNVAIAHAGADPSLPLDMQDTHILRWGHPAFGITARTDGMWVVSGHTIVEIPTVKNGTINVDTGAYATGRLSMARISDQSVAFETFS